MRLRLAVAITALLAAASCSSAPLGGDNNEILMIEEVLSVDRNQDSIKVEGFVVAEGSLTLLCRSLIETQDPPTCGRPTILLDGIDPPTGPPASAAVVLQGTWITDGGILRLTP